jgi:DTW domain-containing protein YfiP
VPALHSRTTVVFLQHPRERHVPIGTARMAHLGLVGSQLVEGLHFDDDERLQHLFAADAHAAVLFPGDDAVPLPQWHTPPRTLVVLDGTWSQASKLLKENPRLASLPRLSFQPDTPGRYRIRREPTDMHLSTVEAIAAVLGALEGTPDAYAPLLQPFDAMVEWQLLQQRTHEADATGARHSRRSVRRHRDLQRSDVLRELRPLLRDPRRVVVIYAEANAHPRAERAEGVPELLHLLAARPFLDDSDPDRFFEAIARPRRPLHHTVTERLGIDAHTLLNGEAIDDVLERFRTFLGDGRLVCWGAFPRDLLAQAGDSRRGFVDVRAVTSRVLGAPAGGIEAAAASLGVVSAAGPTRGASMLAAVCAIVRALPERVGADGI